MNLLFVNVDDTDGYELLCRIHSLRSDLAMKKMRLVAAQESVTSCEESVQRAMDQLSAHVYPSDVTP